MVQRPVVPPNPKPPRARPAGVPARAVVWWWLNRVEASEYRALLMAPVPRYRLQEQVETGPRMHVHKDPPLAPASLTRNHADLNSQIHQYGHASRSVAVRGGCRDAA